MKNGSKKGELEATGGFGGKTTFSPPFQSPSAIRRNTELKKPIRVNSLVAMKKATAFLIGEIMAQQTRTQHDRKTAADLLRTGLKFFEVINTQKELTQLKKKLEA